MAVQKLENTRYLIAAIIIHDTFIKPPKANVTPLFLILQKTLCILTELES